MYDVLTPRLLLHPLGRAAAVRLCAGAPRLAHWAPGYPEAGDRKAAQRVLEQAESTVFGAYEIRTREDGRAVGGAGFHGPMDAAGHVTVGYGLLAAVRGRGYAVEALSALLDLAGRAGARAVDGDADLENVASQRVMARAGMREIGADARVRYFRLRFDGTAEPAA